MNRLHTFRTIADETNREPRTVRLWYQKACDARQVKTLGELIDGVRYFSDEEKGLLLEHLGDRAASSSRKQIDLDVKSGEIVPVELVELPNGGSFDPSVALASLDGAKGLMLEDPSAVVDAVDLLLSQVEDVLESKLNQQQQEIRKTELANQKLQERKAEFKLKTAIAANESRKLAAQQTTATTQLQQTYQEVMAMGKRPSEDNSQE